MLTSFLESVLSYFSSVSENYGVNPLIFATIYFVTVPVFWASVYTLIRNIRYRRPLFWPLTGLAVSQLACYTYLVFVGENLPLWVYALVTGLLVFGVVKTWRYIQSRLLTQEVIIK